MYIACCDDEREELSALTALLHTWAEQRGTTVRFQVFRNATDLLECAPREHFTLYLLDVIMPGVSGMSAAREIRQFDTAADIVFLTSSPGFAYESYGVKALDYLLKPIRAERLFPLLDKILAREQTPQDAISIKSGSTFFRIPFWQISYVEVLGKHLHFHLTDGSEHEVYGTMSEYEPLLLSRPEFMHVHRSYIVNLLTAAELSPSSLSTFTGKNLPVSRRLYPEVQKRYVELFFPERD